MDVQTNTTPVNIEDEMRQSYMDYAMSVIVGRALPDVRDGFKPVQRRILYAMLKEGLLSTRKHSKCAGVVGEVLKRYHPHGDSSVYEALVRLAQPWALRYPLVDGQGNFGSVDGDPAAAYRYTESRLTAFAETLLRDIESETVDFIPNFDDSTMEPVVLPSVLPNLLVNGADGIAVGMATHIPPHNLREIVSAAVALIRDPKISVERLMQLVPGPDFPTGGLIYGAAPIYSAYASGKGILQIRARAEIETIKAGNREVEAIVVTEIPFQVNKARLVEKIAELVNERTIEGISRLRDESDRTGMRIVIELKRDATPEIVLNQLFKLTPMQTSFGVINLAIVDGKPVICTLADLLKYFVNHRRDVIVRRTIFELGKAEERMHILEGFRIALINIDDIIALIKASQTPKEAREGLVTNYRLSEVQAQAILELRLQKLTGMERLAIETEHAELKAEIERLRGILADSQKVDNLIVGELEELALKYGDKRRTEIVPVGSEINVEDLIEDEEMVVTISHQGYIKRTQASLFRAQKRGGKGVSGATSREEDFIEHLFVTSSLSELLVFTSSGRLYSEKVYTLPQGGRTARGRALVNLLHLREDEKIAAILPVREFSHGKFVVMCTRGGIIKKVELMDFANVRRSGIIACTLKGDDCLIGAEISGGGHDVLLATRSGMSVRFPEDQVRAMGRNAAGVHGMRLDEGDLVVSMVVIPSQGAPVDETGVNGAANGNVKDRVSTLLTVCESGYGKRTDIGDYRIQNRGGRGVIDIKTDDRNGQVVGACLVNDESELMMITSSGKIIRFKASDMSVIGRNTKGVRVIDLDEGEKVSAVAPFRGSEGEE